MAYKVEILDSSLTPICKIQVLDSLDTAGNFLKYDTKLSNYGSATFRVGTKDPLFVQYGDILQPYVNHVRISRSDIEVWQGIIVNCPKRNRNFIEVQAHSYLYLLNTVLVRHDTSGDVNYRTFNSGTMASVIQTIMTEAKADGPGVLANMSIGTIENPNFPAGYVDLTNAALSGPWTFSSNLPLKYDYRDILYVLQSLGVYGQCDYELVQSGTNLVFNFKIFLGNKQPNLVFEYKQSVGAIDNYEVPLNGERMANYLVGVAADNQYNILKVDKQDNASIAKYGKIAGVAAYADVKDKNLLTTRLTQELVYSAYPDAEIRAILNDRAYPLGVYGVGDIVTLKIKDHIININQQRRIVGIEVDVHKSGAENILLHTVKPPVTA